MVHAVTRFAAAQRTPIYTRIDFVFVRNVAADYRDTVEDAEATGGVIDGGTWEHRKRAKEMLKTAEDALTLTLQAKGAHHMGQYLPKEVRCRYPLFLE